MKSCKQITQIASNSLEKNLSIGEKIELKLHLVMCRHCRVFYKNNKKLEHILAEYKKLE